MYFVGESCIRCKYGDCVKVCPLPLDCFHEGPNMLVINPDGCIDCAMCEPECPVGAIYSDTEIPEGQESFMELNAELSKVWPAITNVTTPLKDPDDWKEIKDKLIYLKK